MEHSSVSNQKNKLEKGRSGKPERRRYDHRELSEFSEKASHDVERFEPDVLFSFDARGGIWAQDIAERLNLDAPIIIGFRLKPTGTRKPTSGVCFSQCGDPCRSLLHVPTLSMVS